MTPVSSFWLHRFNLIIRETFLNENDFCRFCFKFKFNLNCNYYNDLSIFFLYFRPHQTGLPRWHLNLIGNRAKEVGVWLQPKRFERNLLVRFRTRSISSFRIVSEFAGIQRKVRAFDGTWLTTMMIYNFFRSRTVQGQSTNGRQRLGTISAVIGQSNCSSLS